MPNIKNSNVYENATLITQIVDLNKCCKKMSIFYLYSRKFESWSVKQATDTALNWINDMINNQNYYIDDNDLYEFIIVINYDTHIWNSCFIFNLKTISWKVISEIMPYKWVLYLSWFIYMLTLDYD